jgi:hypothetical protein
MGRFFFVKESADEHLNYRVLPEGYQIPLRIGLQFVLKPLDV